MTLDNFKQMLFLLGCKQAYVKTLSANDNSKNQVYFGGRWSDINILPISNVTAEHADNSNNDRFKATINFSWINEDGNICSAPNAKLILYPKYPEVRFSGFLKGSKNAPSFLMKEQTAVAGRLLFFAVDSKNNVLGHITPHDSELAQEFNRLTQLLTEGIFSVLNLTNDELGNKAGLIKALKRIHLSGWIQSKRLDAFANEMNYTAPNGGGYTLEAELGITPNGYPKPDFKGWEIKQFNVKKFGSQGTNSITLMTPEPNGGAYTKAGAEAFIRRYGNMDAKRDDRMNFSVTHKTGILHPKTGLTLKLIGFDITTNKITSVSGSIALIDENGDDAASWSFAELLLHWNKKHSKACYVPSMTMKGNVNKYHYASTVYMGEGTDFPRFLAAISLGNIFYDPGIKMVGLLNIKPTIKKRSQFRIRQPFLEDLYYKWELLDVLV